MIKFFDLGRNNFVGALPEDIGERWFELRYLHLDHNEFTGTIPDSYPTAGEGRIEAMTFNHNNLEGWIPGGFKFDKLCKWFLCIRAIWTNQNYEGLQRFTQPTFFANWQWNSMLKTMLSQELIRRFANNQYLTVAKWSNTRPIATFANVIPFVNSNANCKPSIKYFHLSTRPHVVWKA